MMEKYKMILMAEEKMAREVTLGVIVTRPLTVWHYIIPGMFIIDFLRRGSALRKYTEHFMFPRKLAIDAAQALAQVLTNLVTVQDLDLDAQLAELRGQVLGQGALAATRKAGEPKGESFVAHLFSRLLVSWVLAVGLANHAL